MINHSYVTMHIAACSKCNFIGTVRPRPCLRCNLLYCESCQGLSALRNNCNVGGGAHYFDDPTDTQITAGHFVSDDDEIEEELDLGGAEGEGDGVYLGEVCSRCNGKFTSTPQRCTTCTHSFCESCVGLRAMKTGCTGSTAHKFLGDGKGDAGTDSEHESDKGRDADVDAIECSFSEITDTSYNTSSISKKVPPVAALPPPYTAMTPPVISSPSLRVKANAPAQNSPTTGIHSSLCHRGLRVMMSYTLFLCRREDWSDLFSHSRATLSSWLILSLRSHSPVS